MYRHSAKRQPSADAIGRNKRQFDDEATIARFGKQQKFKRNFRIVSTVGLSAVVGLSWESVLGNLASLLINGGPAGAFGEFIFSFFGTFSQVLVLAEVASMIPLSGGPYNWVSILAPPRYSGFLSYLTGWATLLAWIAINAGSTYASAAILEALIYLDHPDYGTKPWRVVLIFIAITLLALIFNTVLGRLLPLVESLVLILHVFGFFSILFIFGYLGKKNSASVVFGTFINGGSWPSNSLSFLVGAATCMATFSGADAASHLAEEVEDAARAVPKAMIVSIILNGVTGFGMLIAVLFAMGSPARVLGHKAWYPVLIPILRQVTGSNKATTAIIAVTWVLGFSASIATMTAGSRIVWAFAREDALPFSKHLAKVDKKLLLPLNAIMAFVLVELLLSLIILGSTSVFNAFVGVIIAAFYSTYFIVAALSLYRRSYPDKFDIEWGPFYLGRWGAPLAVFSMVYSVVGWFFSFWPPATPAPVGNFNWSVAIYCGVLIIAIMWWFLGAGRHYKGPKIGALA